MALVSTVVIWVVDNKAGGYLMMSPSQRKAMSDDSGSEKESVEKPSGYENKTFEFKE